jgi:hypothetical protein
VTRKGVGSNGQVPTADSADASGWTWQTPGAASVKKYWWLPADHHHVLWNYDPWWLSSSTAQTTRTPTLVKCWVPENVTATNISIFMNAAAVTLDAGSNRMGIYNSSGTLLSQTADITAWAGGGIKTVALGTPQSLTGSSSAYVWLAFMCSAATPASFYRVSSIGSVPNFGMTASDGYRVGFLAQQTAGNPLPASFNPATDLTASTLTYWMGAS